MVVPWASATLMLRSCHAVDPAQDRSVERAPYRLAGARGSDRGVTRSGGTSERKPGEIVGGPLGLVAGQRRR
jgi:hypothetical protein